MATVVVLAEGEVAMRTGPVRSTAGARAAATTRPSYELAFVELHACAYRAAFKLLGDRAEAEDVAQEALARCYQHWPSVADYAPAWVVRVASNLAIGTWRKRRRLTNGWDPDERAEVAVPDHLELRAALAALPKRQREVVVLRHLGGFSERETAAALGCTTGTVKQHASRGLAALRRRLDVPDEASDPGEEG